MGQIQKDGINYNYEYDSATSKNKIEVPTKFVTVNDSSYPLIDMKNIDWDNALLDQILKIKFIEDYIGIKYDDNNKPILDNYRYKDDIDQTTNLTSKPAWLNENNKGHINSSTELLDLINYILSRIIYIDDAVVDLQDAANLKKIELKFFENDYFPVNPANPSKPSDFTITICPNNPKTRDAEWIVSTFPSVNENINLALSEIGIYNNGNLVSGVTGIIKTHINKNNGGNDVTEQLYWEYVVNLDIYGFDKKYNELDVFLRYTSVLTEHYQAIDPVDTKITIKKTPNLINWLYINNEEYSVINYNNSNVLINTNILNTYLTKDEKNNYIFAEYNGDPQEPNLGSFEWFVKNEYVFNTNPSQGYLSLNIAKNKPLNIKVFPKYYGNNSLDNEDASDNEEVHSLLSIVKNGVNISGLDSQEYQQTNEGIIGKPISKTIIITNEDKTTSELTFNGFEYEFTPSIDINNSEYTVFSLSLKTTGTKYIQYNNIFNGLPISLSNLSNINFSINETTLKSVNSEFQTYEQIKSSLDTVDNRTRFNVELPIYTRKSFNDNNPETTKDWEEYNGITITPNSFYMYFTPGFNETDKDFFNIYLEDNPSINLFNKIEIDKNTTFNIWANDEVLKRILLNNNDSSSENNNNLSIDKVVENVIGEYLDIKKSYNKLSQLLNIKVITKKATVDPNYTIIYNETAESVFYLPIVYKIPAKLSGTGTLYGESSFIFNIKIVRGNNELIAPKYKKDTKVVIKVNEPCNFSNIIRQIKQYPWPDDKKDSFIIGIRSNPEIAMDISGLTPVTDKNETYQINSNSVNYIIQRDNIAKTLTLMEFDMTDENNKYNDELIIQPSWPKFIIYADKEYLGRKYDFSKNQALVFSKDVDKDLTLINYGDSTSQGIGGNLDKIYGETMGIKITYQQWQDMKGSIDLNEFFANGILCGDRLLNNIEIYYKDIYSNELYTKYSDYKRMGSIDIKTTFATWSSMIDGKVNVIEDNEFELDSETLTLKCQNWKTIHNKSNITGDNEGDVILIVYIWVNPTSKFNGKTFCLQFYIKNQ